MAELKPCPFCGSNYVFVRTTHKKDGLSNTQYEAYCSKCSAVGGSRIEEQKAIEAWNTRTSKEKGDEEMNVGIHKAHCCKFHGCKYGDKDCPIVNGKEKQLYLCEDCYEDLENEVYYKEVLKTVEEIKELQKVLKGGVE